MASIDKKEATVGRLQYHTRVKPGDIGDYVLLPGDPKRSDIFADYIDDAELIANNREHRTVTGTYKGIKVSCTSTGMGCPSTAIAAEELINVGAKYLIRIGSTGALQPDIQIGDLVISTGSMKNEGTSRFYVPDVFPAVPDFDFTSELLRTARLLQKKLGYGLFYGINASDDAFYGETPEWIEKLSKLGVLNVDMESSALYTVCHMRGVKGAMISAVSGNLVRNDVIYEKKNDRLAEGWENEIQVVLETIAAIDQKRKEATEEEA